MARLEKVASGGPPTAAPPVAVWRDVDLERFRNEISTRNEPSVLRGAVAHWPAVAAGKQSAEATAAYLSQFDRGAEVRAFIAPSEVEGRYFYNPAVDGFNFGVANIGANRSGEMRCYPINPKLMPYGEPRHYIP